MFHETMRSAITDTRTKPPTLTTRRRRGLWSPSPAGPYELPREIQARLVAALGGLKNRDAVMALAVFLARYWSAPARLVLAFPVDRRALMNRDGLDLTEARIRGAVAALEAVGFLERDIPAKGSLYRATEAGLHRKPVLWRFGSDFAQAFVQTNRRSRAGRGAAAPAWRPIAPAMALRRPETTPVLATKHPETLQSQLAQKEVSSRREILMGENVSLAAPLTPLETALARLAKVAGFEKHEKELPEGQNRPEDGAS